MKPTLVIMAAGMGSRYGGLKQIEPVGQNGEILMEYSIYDALRAGFGRVVFVIKADIYEDFKTLVGNKIAARAPVSYVYQRNDALPEGFAPPPGRVKPWGTGHAVLSCLGAVNEPFCVVNADDFYGRPAFESMADYLNNLAAPPPLDCCLIGFLAVNTMTEHGSVSRACCELDAKGRLVSLTERLRLRVADGELCDLDALTTLPNETMVSCSMMGFPPEILPLFERQFALFLNANRGRLDRAEFYLPSAVSELLRTGEAAVSVLPTNSRWYGFTYREDREALTRALTELTRNGEYPDKLWA